MKSFLKYINSIPIPLTIKYRYDFDETNSLLKDGELNSSESWDALRENHPHFSISQDREEWLKASEVEIKKDGQDGGLVKRANDLVKIFDELFISHVFSAGVGGAGLEYQIKKLRPNLHLTCSEYSRVSVDRLKKVFTECESIVLFDINSKDWSVAINNIDPKKQICLLYRIDIGFSDEEFLKIFRNMHDSGIENILIIMCGQLTLLRLFNRLVDWVRFVVKHGFKKRVFSGFLRTVTAFEYGWFGLYESREIECGGIKSFILRRVG